MARCDCAGLGVEGCMCALQAGDNVTVTGTGQALDPWVVSGIPPAPYTEGQAIDIVANAISVDVSSDAGNQLVLGGDGGLFVPAPAASGGALGMVVYLTVAGGTWDKATYPDANWLRVRVIGGGGGGAGATSAASQAIARGGGAGGNYGESWIDVSTLGASTTVTVGAGGSAGAAANGAGGTGGTSSFGTAVIALGGGGAPNTAVSAAAGVSPSGDPQGLGTHQVYTLGERGQRGIWHSATVGMAGGGGSGGCGFGTGGRGGISGGAANGQTGSGPGGGGGGGHSQNAAVAAGGAGGPGAVIVEMFT
uniref:Tail fiber assembly n=1 Tax=Streptomyces phage Geonosis TaxID=3158856 RepID=A0AAU7GWC0_9CAUD